MTATLTLFFEKEHYNRVCMATIPEGWVGFCDAITIEGNTRLTGEPVRFDGRSRESVIEQVISELQSRGLSGTLKIKSA